jgi:cytochrome c oxidase cbb3-type subunit 3
VHERRAIVRLVAAAVCLLALTACQRESRQPRPEPAAAALYSSAIRESALHPGGPESESAPANPYEGNAYAISEGKRLYESYNCSGCHSHGGGGIGPPLIKQHWIYGGEPANLFETIVKGRPNGMPTWGSRIPANQVWEIVTYIRSMNQQEPTAATPARNDNLQVQPSIRDVHTGQKR